MPFPLIAAAAATLAMPEASLQFLTRVMALTSGEPQTNIGLFVAPDGTVIECKVLRPQLSKEDEQAVCGRALGKDVGKGAKGPDGKPAYGTLLVSAVLRDARPEPFPPANELEIVVSHMPGKQKALRVELTVYVDAKGKVEQCEPERKKDSDFSRVACQQSARNTLPIKMGKSGAPVGYVTEIAVDFVPESAASR